ncbi:MAG TPA: PQQ-binding-like beta-propeller repeat protein [Longimicrobium sp.]|nr:PQQ-binding-like beta-propeller repeat protein [Longimicrobium sp.]
MVKKGFALAFVLVAFVACGDVTGAGRGKAPEVIWRTPLAVRYSTSDQTPAADGERLYAIAGGMVTFSAHTGEIVWTYSLDRYIPSNAVLRNGRVFAAENIAFALDAETGAELWRFTPDEQASHGESTADEHAFYFGTWSHRVYALDQATGALLWSTDIGPDWQYTGIVKGVSVSGDTVYAAAREYTAANGYISNGWIVALDRTTGRELWRYRSGNGSQLRSVSSALTVAGRLLLASDLHGSSFFAVDRFTGQEVWRVESAPGFVGPVQAPVAVGDVAYLASNDEYVYAVELQTGRIIWKTHTPASNNAFVVCDDQIFVTWLGLSVLDRRTGRVLYQSPVDQHDFPTSRFARHGDRVYVLGSAAAYAYRCK